MHTRSNAKLPADNQPHLKHIDRLMFEALAAQVFPGAVLLFSREGVILHHGAYGVGNLFTDRPMTLETVFDLASLTKPLATALAVMILQQQGRLGLEQNLGELLPACSQGPKAGITVMQLLVHAAGLADYKPYYKEIGRQPPKTGKQGLRDLLAAEPLLYLPGTRVLYSDLGFMILEWLVEQAAGKRLDRFVSEMIYTPLGLRNLFFVDLNAPAKPDVVFAATEQCPWRERLLEGQVHDENAYAAGGIQGHAGLFGTAADVHALLGALVDAYGGKGPQGIFETQRVRLYFKRSADRDRTPGFDTPSAHHSSAGRWFSANSVGHLGFTGTSFWMDLDRRIIVILLTNRIHPTRDNQKIKAFRPQLHDAVMKFLLAE